VNIDPLWSDYISANVCKNPETKKNIGTVYTVADTKLKLKEFFIVLTSSIFPIIENHEK